MKDRVIDRINNIRSDAELQHLCRLLQKEADEETDVRLYRICASCRKASRSLQGEKLMELPAVIVV